jgi:hypothetical protein
MIFGGRGSTAIADTKERRAPIENILLTRSIVIQKFYVVIIITSSGENNVSKEILAKLDLKTKKQPSPYKIG